MGNPGPVLIARGVRVGRGARKIGTDGLKVALETARGPLDSVGWGMAARAGELRAGDARRRVPAGRERVPGPAHAAGACRTSAAFAPRGPEVSELRIVAGEWRGRRIAVPGGNVRPTADRVREAWMSIVHAGDPRARVADLCAGSGALGLEALSRGAAHCDFVEQDPKVLTALRANIATLGAADRAAIVHRGAALRVRSTTRCPDGLADAPWDVAFADPPYEQGLALALAERWLRAPFATIFGVEHEAALTLPDAGDGTGADLIGSTATYRRAITFYRMEPDDAQGGPLCREASTRSRTGTRT